MDGSVDHPEGDGRDPENYTKFDVFERRLVNSVAIVAAYECDRHNPNIACRCEAALSSLTPKTKELYVYIDFVQAWEQCLLANNAAFIFKNDHGGNLLFERLNKKQTAQGLATSFATRAFAEPTMLAPATSLENTIKSMLAFWDNRASNWKSKYSNKDAARDELKACMTTDFGDILYGNLDKRNDDFSLKLGQGLLFAQRYHKSPRHGRYTAPKGAHEHSCTVFLMPLLPQIRGQAVYVRHKLLGVRACHRRCVEYQPVVNQTSIEGFRKACLGERSALVTLDGKFEISLTDLVDGAFYT